MSPGPHQLSYSSTGTKTVTLTVVNAAGQDVETKTNYIQVNRAPEAIITADGNTAANYGYQ